MARRSNRKYEIMKTATTSFLEIGYTKTLVANIAKSLKISLGNLTFHYRTKEEMLSELVQMLCEFQQQTFERETNEGYSSIMAVCLELAAMASMSEDDEVIKDFYISSYCSSMCLSIIRKNDTERAKKVFKDYCPSWSHENFEEAEILVSGIEYSTLMSTDTGVSLEIRIAGALNTILSIYGVPEDVRKTKIDKVLSMDYHRIGHRMLKEFREYVDQRNDQVLSDHQQGGKKK